MKIAVLRNPKSSRNAGRRAPALAPGIQSFDLAGIAALPGTLREIRQEGVELIVIDGGDGTIREVVSHLSEVFGDRAPVIGLIAHGNTNLIARKYGRLSGYAALDALAAQDLEGLGPRTRPAPLMRIDGLREGPVRGFIAGWGAYASGTKIAIEELRARGGRQVLGAVLSTMRRSFFGRDNRALRAGIPAEIAPIGHEPRKGATFAGIATVLEGSLVAGLQPFWGPGSGPIRWLDIKAPPRRLLVAAPFIALGRPRPWMTRAGYRSGRSDGLSLALEGEIVVDGEIFACSADRPLRFSAKERVSFLSD